MQNALARKRKVTVKFVVLTLLYIPTVIIVGIGFFVWHDVLKLGNSA